MEELGEFRNYIERIAKGQAIEILRHGMETSSVVRVGEWVYKCKVGGCDDIAINWHNRFFGNNTLYEIIGAGRDGKHSGVVVRQPYVEFEKGSNGKALEQMAQDFANKFGRALIADTEIWSNGWHFDNLNWPNVGIDKNTGLYAVIDCLIRQRPEPFVRDLWSGCDFAIREVKNAIRAE